MPDKITAFILAKKIVERKKKIKHGWVNMRERDKNQFRKQIIILIFNMF